MKVALGILVAHQRRSTRVVVSTPQFPPCFHGWEKAPADPLPRRPYLTGRPRKASDIDLRRGTAIGPRGTTLRTADEADSFGLKLASLISSEESSESERPPLAGPTLRLTPTATDLPPRGTWQ